MEPSSQGVRRYIPEKPEDNEDYNDCSHSFFTSFPVDELKSVENSVVNVRRIVSSVSHTTSGKNSLHYLERFLCFCRFDAMVRH